MDEVENELRGFGCELEWQSHDLLGVAVLQDHAQSVADYLYDQEENGRLEYETSRLKHINQ